MNSNSQKTKSIPWLKVLLFGVVLICVAYFSGREGLEQMLGLDPGTLGGNVQQVDNDISDSPSHQSERESNQTSEKPSSADEVSQPVSNTNKGYLKKNDFVMESPEGLTYYIGTRGENRVEHVLRHAKDNPTRNRHGVFDGTEDEIFQTIDEAYRLVKQKSKQVVKTERDRDITSRVAYDVDMKRRIGYFGGREGKSKGNPAQKVLRLVLDKEIRVITAFPCR